MSIADSLEKIELLAPGGDLDSIKAAIVAGADAVYLGLEKFNARNRAENIGVDDLPAIVHLAGKHHCSIFVTLNILIVDSEIGALITLLNKLVNIRISGVIVQDIGLFYLLSKYYSNVRIHASTQLTTHNSGQIQFLHALGAKRVNLARELNLSEIRHLSSFAHKHKMKSEVFVHGSYCISFSGICYFSSYQSGNSGNRGRCSQPCKSAYCTTAAGSDFPFNLKDNAAFCSLAQLVKAGVDSLKIEGRIKKFHYVYAVVQSYRKQLTRIYQDKPLLKMDEALYRVFNRDFTSGFLHGAINGDMYSDSPRDFAANRLARMQPGVVEENIAKAKQELHDEKTVLINGICKKIQSLSCEKIPITVEVFAKQGVPLRLHVFGKNIAFTLSSTISLTTAGNALQERGECFSLQTLHATLQRIDTTKYRLAALQVASFEENLFLPFKELTQLRRDLFAYLHEGKSFVDPVSKPVPSTDNRDNQKASLCCLLDSEEDLFLCEDFDATFFFQIPDSLQGCYDAFVALFKKHKTLLPWFPSIIMEEDFYAATAFLQEIQPRKIVTNNSGIAFFACQHNIPWIAGPYLNNTNSFALLHLQKRFNCQGAFVSRELKRVQLKALRAPENFALYCSIYYPILLLSSRQCLLRQVTGCEKQAVDLACVQQCEQHAYIKNRRGEDFVIVKSKGNHHCLYATEKCLNLEILQEIPGRYSGCLVDLRKVPSNTRQLMDTKVLLKHFTDVLGGSIDAQNAIVQTVTPVNNDQYATGI